MTHRDTGRVILVGAGPGDPGLMTARALEAIAAADVILYDKLIPATALDGAREDAALIDVGKVGGGEQVPQEETHRLLLLHAQEGKLVVRVKGGDPFVFGRGGEEALLCREHGIAFEVVPGVTAGIAGPAYAGIPVTQRGMASAVAFVTGHEDPAKAAGAGGGDGSQIDWPALAAFPGTLVFYMGVRALPRIAEQLVLGGRPATEPVAIVERGTLPDQRAVHGTLETIAALADAAAIKPPSVTIVGPVAALGEELAWLGRGPLESVSVVVTRPRAQASALARALRDLGARVIEAATIVPEPLDFAIPDLNDYDLVVLSSPNGVARFFAQLRADGRDARALAGRRVAVIGPGTADALRGHGVEPDLIPRKAVGESLAELVAGRDDVASALIVRARGGRDIVRNALDAQGVRVDVIEPYVTVAEPLDAGTRASALDADWATFTSASSARFFLEAAGGADEVRASGLRLASIGPITTEALRALGLEPDVEAAEHTPGGLVDALVAAVAARAG
ncbi:Siroheme synthase [Baekduia alba]|uniref:uroporphyrinogen-III C-methyltransferase n=1 Tax=Baekduia alba TaxID=2997333 RepID=UPI00234046C0|nr:uroporphyrinogen-III C-methyltransferase [Baekduia alba]WCB96988.1 Siroheme synthase [Baekduia alba]